MLQIANVPGLAATSDAFRRELARVAGRIGTTASNLAAVISFETGATFSPSVLNAAGSGAVGLLQFMPATARGLGTTAAELAQMSAVDQLSYVEKYLRRFTGRIAAIESLYMAVLWPAAVGKGPDFVLFREGSKEYEQNAPLDRVGKGYVTAGDAAAGPRAKLAAAKGFFDVDERIADPAVPLSSAPPCSLRGGSGSATNGPARVYVVSRGDTMTGIAQAFTGRGLRWPELARANPAATPDRIVPGQRLTIPADWPKG